MDCDFGNKPLIFTLQHEIIGRVKLGIQNVQVGSLENQTTKANIVNRVTGAEFEEVTFAIDMSGFLVLEKLADPEPDIGFPYSPFS